MGGVTFDAGALIAFERGSREVTTLVARAVERGDRVAIPAGVVAQVWRNGTRQVRLARLLGSPVVDVRLLDDRTARAVGQLLGATGTTDVVDGSVVWAARQSGQAVVTGDATDLLALDPTLKIVTC